jgi:hypothetical protein
MYVYVLVVQKHTRPSPGCALHTATKFQWLSVCTSHTAEPHKAMKPMSKSTSHPQ